MSRYIDADALLESVKNKRLIFEESTPVEEVVAEQVSAFEEAIEEAPTADVVPRSEVDALAKENERLMKEKTALECIIATARNQGKAEAKTEVAREIFAAIEFDIHQLMFERDETRAIAIEGVIANLKKEYTEGEE